MVGRRARYARRRGSLFVSLHAPPRDRCPPLSGLCRVDGRVAWQAWQFVSMMYELWDERGKGVLTPSQFDRAAHQHPVLVQAFIMSNFHHHLGECIMSSANFIIALANPS